MTKIIIQSASVALLLSAMFTGCTNAQPSATGYDKEVKADLRCYQDSVLAPDFTCDPYAEGAVTALGIAKINAGGDKSFQRTEAMASARDELARNIEVRVSNLFKKFKASTGSGTNETFDKSTSDVSKQLASQTLRGAKQIGRSWRHPKTGELFIMVGISTDVVEDNMENAIKTSFKNDRAMYQKFLAEQANGELEKELEKAAR